MIRGIGTAAVTLNGYLANCPQFHVQKRKADYLGHTYRWVADKFEVMSTLMGCTEFWLYLFQFRLNATMAITQKSVFPEYDRLTAVPFFFYFPTQGGVRYYVKGNFLEDLRNGHILEFVANSLCLSVGLGLCLSLAKEFNLVNLGAMAQSIGNTSLFGIMPFRMISQLAIGEFCFFAATGACLFSAVNCAMKIQGGDISKSRLAQLAYCIASFVTQIFMIAGPALVAAPMVFTIAGSLGMISAGYGAWWIYQRENEKS